jgi:hypothetical protein
MSFPNALNRNQRAWPRMPTRGGKAMWLARNAGHSAFEATATRQ